MLPTHMRGLDLEVDGDVDFWNGWLFAKPMLTLRGVRRHLQSAGSLLLMHCASSIDRSGF